MKTKLLLALCAVIAMNAFAQFPTNGLLAQYNFDSTNPLQEQTNGDNFIKTGTNALAVADRFGNNDAYSLNGDYLERSNVPSTSSDISLGFWIKSSSLNNNEEIIINDTNTADPDSFATGLNNDTGYLITLKNGVIHLKAQAKAESGSNAPRFYRVVTNNSVNVNDGRWHHVYVYINENTSTPGLANMSAQINVDGTLTSATGGNNQFPSTFTFTGIHSTGTMTVGNGHSSLPFRYRYQGAIDELLIYDRGLTATELQTIRTVGNYCLPPDISIVSVSVTGETTANIAISGTTGATYDIAYVKVADNFSSRSLITGLTANANIPNLVSVNLTNLEPSTPYYVYVREQCTNTTLWSSFRNFRTQGVIYIDENATGLNDGSSWANAYTSLQTAINTPIIGQEYWIAKGTYKPTTSGDRFASFDFFARNIKVYGGFAGTETQLSDRVLGIDETILSGDLLGDDSGSLDYNNLTKVDNSLRLVDVRGDNALLDGLTITNGFANGGGANSVGAAVYKNVFVRKLTMQNCKITNNVSVNGANVDMPFSASVLNDVIIDKCDFNNNLGSIGSSLRVNSAGSFASTTRVKVYNSLFANNRASGFAGSSMWIASLNNNTLIDVDIANNTFVNNIDEGNSPNGSNNTNRATLVMFLQPAVSTLTGTVSNSIFWNNKARGGVLAKATSAGLESPGDIDFFNCLDEDNFSNINASKKINISDSDPQFANSSIGDFQLTTGSPAIDMGDNTYVVGTTDLLGNQRIFNSAVDMGAYEFGSSVLGVDDFGLETPELVIYPNPVSHILNIQNQDGQIKDILILNMLGQQVLKTTNKHIDVSNFKNGIYILKAKTASGNIVKRFIKQ